MRLPRGWWFPWLVGLGAGLALSHAGLAQPLPHRLPRPLIPGPSAALPVPSVSSAPASPGGPNQDQPASLTSRLGLAVAEGWLRSSDPEERRRALVRLGELGTERALGLLSGAVDTGGTARTAAEYFSAVRALGRHASRPEARQALVRLMNGAGADKLALPAEQRLVRETAALALGAYGGAEGLRLVARALRQPGPLASAATRALIAHPPRVLEPVLAAPGPATVELVRLLETLGDQRAFSFLRHLVVTAEARVRARAAVALTRLGHLETVPLAVRWSAEGQPEALKAAGTRILALTHAAEWPGAVRGLLDDVRTRDVGLALAAEAGHPALAESLARCVVEASSPEQAGLALTALSRAGGPRAVRALAGRLGDPALGSSAAYALAQMPDPEAASALETALKRPELAARAARAGVIRQVVLGEPLTGLPAALERMLASSVAAQRAAGAWGLGTLEPERLASLLRSADPVVVRSAARTLTQATAQARTVAAHRLEIETDRTTREALALVLVHTDAATRVSSWVLRELVDSAGAAAPLAIYRLVARSDAPVEQVVLPLMTSADALWRVHAALGLGSRREQGSVALLEDAYARETNEHVRRAIVTALGLHARGVPFGTLRLASTLDPDQDTRQAARSATLGHAWRDLEELHSGPSSAWIELRSAGAANGVVYPPAIVRTSAGLALPVFPDPDGLIAIVGLPVGPIALRSMPNGGADARDKSGGLHAQSDLRPPVGLTVGPIVRRRIPHAKARAVPDSE